MNFPLIRIKYSRFLDLNFSDFEKVETFNNEWKKCEVRLLSAICEILQLEFKQNTIDVYISSGLRSFSDPMVISHKFSPEEFPDILLHELLHRLISDNTKDTWKKFGKEWDAKTPGEERLVLNHILVHAVSQHVYLDVLNDPVRLDRDIANCQKNPPYARSWEIVKEKGYKNIIKEFIELTKK